MALSIWIARWWTAKTLATAELHPTCSTTQHKGPKASAVEIFSTAFSFGIAGVDSFYAGGMLVSGKKFFAFFVFLKPNLKGKYHG